MSIVIPLQTLSTPLASSPSAALGRASKMLPNEIQLNSSSMPTSKHLNVSWKKHSPADSSAPFYS